MCAVRMAGKLYCKQDADRAFGLLKEQAEGGLDVLEVSGSKVGMVMTLLGGCVYLFLTVLTGYALLVSVNAVSITPYVGTGEASAALRGLAYVVVGMVITSIGILIGGAFLNSNRSSHRLQGGAIAIVSAVVGLMVVLALPYAVIPGGSPGFFYGAAAGAAFIFFIIEFGGFILVLIGGALGMTRKSASLNYE